MRNLIQFPNRRRGDEEACAWIAKLDRGLSAAEERELAEWLKSRVNRDALSELSALWDELDALAEISALFPAEDEHAVEPRPEHGRWLRAALAAVVVICISVPAWYLFTGSMGSQSARHSASAVQVFATAVGGMREIALADGTTLVLNTDTLLQVEYSSASRLISLRRGEAHFDVAPDVARPFRVRVASHELTAVGTVFNVEERPNDVVELIVTEGEVRVGAAAVGDINVVREADGRRRRASVLAGEVAVIEPGGQSIQAIDAREVEARLAWQRGELVFRGETLNEVLAEFARYSPTPLVLDDSTLGAIPVVGYFEAGSPDSLLELLSENFDIEVERRNGRVALKAR